MSSIVARFGSALSSASSRRPAPACSAAAPPAARAPPARREGRRPPPRSRPCRRSPCPRSGRRWCSGARCRWRPWSWRSCRRSRPWRASAAARHSPPPPRAAAPATPARAPARPTRPADIIMRGWGNPQSRAPLAGFSLRSSRLPAQAGVLTAAGCSAATQAKPLRLEGWGGGGSPGAAVGAPLSLLVAPDTGGRPDVRSDAPGVR